MQLFEEMQVSVPTAAAATTAAAAALYLFWFLLYTVLFVAVCAFCLVVFQVHPNKLRYRYVSNSKEIPEYGLYNNGVVQEHLKGDKKKGRSKEFHTGRNDSTLKRSYVEAH